MAKECFRLFLAFGGRDDGDGEAEDIFGVLVGGLGEHRVFLEPYRDVAHLIDSGYLDTAKVFDARQDDVDELIEERLHAHSPQSDLIADDVADARFEISD